MTRKYCEKYDAYFESRTGEWLEGKCQDRKCEFCRNRPEKHPPHKWELVDGKEGVCS